MYLVLMLSLTFLSTKSCAKLVKSASQPILPCSIFTIIMLWKVRASVHCKYSRTVVTACRSADLPRDSTPPQHVTIYVKQERNFERLIFSLVIFSPSSSFAIVCSHSSVFITGLFWIFAPDFTFLLLHIYFFLTLPDSVPELSVVSQLSSGNIAPASLSLTDNLLPTRSCFLLDILDFRVFIFVASSLEISLSELLY